MASFERLYLKIGVKQPLKIAYLIKNDYFCLLKVVRRRQHYFEADALILGKEEYVERRRKERGVGG